MRRRLEFEHDGRHYDAHVGDSGAAREWWRFTVSGDGHRYGAFPASDNDRDASVRSRIIYYYENLLDRRAGRAFQRVSNRKPAPS